MLTGEEPAFPIIPFNKDDRDLVETAQLYSGLTIRQEFARSAMASLAPYHLTQLGPRDAAEIAVQFADALIAELNQGPRP